MKHNLILKCRKQNQSENIFKNMYLKVKNKFLQKFFRSEMTNVRDAGNNTKKLSYNKNHGKKKNS